MRRVAFDHVAIAVSRIADALPFLIGELGGRPAGGGAAPAFLFRQWKYGRGKLEVLEPAGDEGGFLHRFLESRGPGVHHVTFEVPRIAAACDLAEELGFAVVGHDFSDPDWQEAFLHPKGAMSLVVQLVERGERAGGDREPRVHRPVEGDPEPGPLGIDLVGLRLGAWELERARRLWCELLGGESRERSGEIEMRWPGSPMRLVVRRVSAGDPEGPLAVELACMRPALLPSGPHPVLGAVFAPVDVTALEPPTADGESALGRAAGSGEGEGSAAGAEESYCLDGDALDSNGDRAR